MKDVKVETVRLIPSALMFMLCIDTHTTHTHIYKYVYEVILQPYVSVAFTLEDLSLASCRTDPSRQSGFVYLTPERRLTLPPESVLVLTPTLSLPMGRNLPFGYGASMIISIPFKSASHCSDSSFYFFFHSYVTSLLLLCILLYMLCFVLFFPLVYHHCCYFFMFLLCM